MADPSSAYEDMLFFERRLNEVICGMQPKVRKWRIILFVLLSSTVFTAYYWISDPDLQTISLRESLMKHPMFTTCISVLLVLFVFFGVHKRVVAPKMIAQRCRYVLSDFCLSCDEYGKLIVRPAYRSCVPTPAVSPSSSSTAATAAATATAFVHPPPLSASPPPPPTSQQQQQQQSHIEEAALREGRSTKLC